MKPTLLRKAMLSGGRTDYFQKVLRTASANIIEYWPMREGGGTTIKGIKNARNGTYSGVTWGGGLVSGEKAPIVVDSGDTLDLFSAGFATGWGTGAEGTVLLWTCSAVLGASVDLSINNYGTGDAEVGQTLGASGVYVYYSQDGIDAFEATGVRTSWRWVHSGISWTTTGNAQTAYVGGSAIGTAAFKGAFIPTAAGADGSSYPGSYAKLAHLCVWNTCLSAAQIAGLARL